MLNPENVEPQTPARPRARHAVTVIAVLLSIAALHFSRPVMLPFVTGLVMAALVWPLYRRLEVGHSRTLALLVTILALITAVLVILGAIGWSTVSIANDLRERSDRIADLHGRASATLGRFGIELPPLGTDSAQAGGAAGDPQSQAGEPAGSSEPGGNGLARRVGIVLYSLLGGLGLAIGFAALALAELRAVRHRVRVRFEPARADRILGISSEVAASIRRYFKVKSVTSTIAGVSTGILSLLFGIKFALVWALLAFLFEYVPTIGSILAVIPPVTYAFVQFDDMTKPFIALGVFMVVQLFLGNYVDPRIEGRLLSISPLIVLLAIVFGAWLWGAPGSLLGVPMVVALTVITRHFASTRWVWAILTEADEDETGRAQGDRTTSAARDR